MGTRPLFNKGYIPVLVDFFLCFHKNWQDMKRLNVLLLVFITFFCGCNGQKKWNTATLLYFDTLCEVTLFCSPIVFDEAVTEIEHVFKEIEVRFSPDSQDLTSPRVVSLFHKAFEIYRFSGGCFDISIAPLSRIWGFINKDYHIPDKKELMISLSFVGMNKINIAEGRIVLKPGMSLDWGGIAKGYGVDKASQTARKKGILKGFINSGGDLFCWGKNPDNRPWQIGINHPRKSGYLGILSLSNNAAATTGDYQRFFIKNGIRYHHVFDPKTGFPAQGKQSVTVIGPEALICDALSTALFVSNNIDSILAFYPEYGAVISDDSGKITTAGKAFSFRPGKQ
jgi:thiamine biosynthesis lipoprotein